MKKQFIILFISFMAIMHTGAQVTITVPDIYTNEIPGTTIEIPVTVSNLTGLGVTAYQFVFLYSNAVIIPKSPFISTTGTLSEAGGMMVMHNTGITNQVNIAAAGSIPLEGEGTLLKLIFEIATTGGTCPLELTDCIFNAGTPQAIVVNGSITVTNCTPEQHFLLIPPGWSGISSYLQPVNPNLETMFAPIVSELIMVGDYGFNNSYSPPNAIFPNEGWDNSKGYFIKVNSETIFIVSGCETEEKTIALNTGWNLVPIVSNCIFLVEDVLNGVDFEIVQAAAGIETYWPAQSIQTLYFMEPGKAYLIKMNAQGSVTFPNCK